MRGCVGRGRGPQADFAGRQHALFIPCCYSIAAARHSACRPARRACCCIRSCFLRLALSASVAAPICPRRARASGRPQIDTSAAMFHARDMHQVTPLPLAHTPPASNAGSSRPVPASRPSTLSFDRQPPQVGIVFLYAQRLAFSRWFAPHARQACCPRCVRDGRQGALPRNARNPHSRGAARRRCNRR